MIWKRKKDKNIEFRCSECGQIHQDWPALTYSSPSHYNSLTEDEKKAFASIDTDFCEIWYSEQTDRFIRVVLIQRVIDNCMSLEYGLWVSLSENSFNDYKANFNNQNQETKYFGWLSNYLPDYDDTTKIPTTVITKPGNQRPEIIPHEDFEHDFVRDYYHGITTKEAEKRINKMLDNIKPKQ
ncbi:MAG: DUF2199 domain-containing protein [Bacteroidales bacterium]|nr:DUF2199 domain-containing protein [Bacteroidales bacterium]